MKIPLYKLLGFLTSTGLLATFERLSTDNNAAPMSQSIGIGIMRLLSLPSVENFDLTEYAGLVDYCVATGIMSAQNKTDLYTLAAQCNPPTVTPANTYIPYTSPDISNDIEAITTLLTNYVNGGGNTTIEYVVSYVNSNGYKCDGNSISPILNNILNPPPVITTTTTTTTLPPLTEPTAEEIKSLIRNYILINGNTNIIINDITAYINNNLPAGYANDLTNDEISPLVNEVLAE